MKTTNTETDKTKYARCTTAFLAGRRGGWTGAPDDDPAHDYD